MQHFKVTLIGAGNLATHLAKALFNADISVHQIFSRILQPAEELAQLVNSSAITDITAIDPTVDIIFICVSDSAIENIIQSITFQPRLIVHTAGSIPMDVLKKFENFGVLYPLQTFSKKIDLVFQNVPVCLEANSQENIEILAKVAEKITKSVYQLSTEQRLYCHLAAVFANNFTNHMFAIAEQILVQNDISFDILKPIIRETVRKISNNSPVESQTGPAARNDKLTMNKHIELLNSSVLEKIYSFVSQNISEFKTGEVPNFK